jgi:hemolysin III
VKIREPFNGISHFIGAVASLIGLIALIVLTPDEPVKRASLIIYGGSLFLMFAASTTYHSVPSSPELRAKLRKIDHAAIFILIAGSYTPICMHYFTGFWRWGVLTIVWTTAIVGIVYKSFQVGKSDWRIISVYLLMGFGCLAAIGEIMRSMPPNAIWLLALGGIIYGVGAFVYAAKWLDFKPGVFGFHEVWHLFVMGGALAHYLLMLWYVVPA